jgi:hypothetical protein
MFWATYLVGKSVYLYYSKRMRWDGIWLFGASGVCSHGRLCVWELRGFGKRALSMLDAAGIAVFWDVDAEDPDQIMALMPYSIHHSSISGVILLNQSKVKRDRQVKSYILKLK